MDKGTKNAINYLINRIEELETDLERERERVKLVRTKFPKKKVRVMKKWKRILLTMLGFILALCLCFGYVLLATHLTKNGHPIIGWGMLGLFMLGVIFVATLDCVNHD